MFALFNFLKIFTNFIKVFLKADDIGIVGVIRQ